MTPDFESVLRGAAPRGTRPRLAVLPAVHDHPYADTDSIIGVGRDDLGEVSRLAGYEVLHALTAAGLARPFEPMDSVHQIGWTPPTRSAKPRSSTGAGAPRVGASSAVPDG
jgi:Fe2+ or Zn2+ uptake regulation protein